MIGKIAETSALQPGIGIECFGNSIKLRKVTFFDTLIVLFSARITCFFCCKPLQNRPGNTFILVLKWSSGVFSV